MNNTLSFTGWIKFLKFIELAKANKGYYYDEETNTHYTAVKKQIPQ